MDSRLGLSTRWRVGLALLAAFLAAWPLTSAAQQPASAPRLGILTWDKCLDAGSAFGKALADLGHHWGKNIDAVCRSAEGDHARLATAAADLVAAKVDIIAALTHVTAYAARQATASIPIVMIASGDPVRSGLVSSLSRPEGNVTGQTYYALELVEKRLQLLKEIVPDATRIAVLANPDSDHVFGIYRQDAARAAHLLGVQLVRADAARPEELERAFESFSQAGAGALLVLTDPMFSAQARGIAALAAKYRLPAMYWAPWFVEAGGLVAYSADYNRMMQRAAHYVDQILKGRRPSDLPVEQPTKFDLAINLKTAKALGIEIPPSILSRADVVIE